MNLVQNADEVRFVVIRWSAAGGFRNVLSTRAASLRDLRAARPAEFEDLVVPLLAKFSDLPFLRPAPPTCTRRSPTCRPTRA